MIGRLRGEVAGIGADRLLIDVGGVAYVLQCGSRLLSRFAVGERAEVFVETQMRETAITLFGFESDEARAWFARLQDVPGVGAKAAMAIMDVLSPAELMDAIAIEDAASIARAKGVGKKIAERVTAELNGKPPPIGLLGAFVREDGGSATAPATDDGPTVGVPTGARADAVSALINLGYGNSDAARAVASAARKTPDAGADALIRGALKELAT